MHTGIQGNTNSLKKPVTPPTRQRVPMVYAGTADIVVFVASSVLKVGYSAICELEHVRIQR